VRIGEGAEDECLGLDELGSEIGRQVAAFPWGAGYDQPSRFGRAGLGMAG